MLESCRYSTPHSSSSGLIYTGAQVVRTENKQAPGLDDVDLQEPVFDLLIKVQKTCEQKLVHGRYLDPVL